MTDSTKATKATATAGDSAGIAQDPPAPPTPAEPAALAQVPEPAMATLLVEGADGAINLGGIYYSAVNGEVQVPVLAVPDFLRRVPGSSIKESDPGSPTS